MPDDQKPGFGDFLEAAENPAAPTGLRETARNAGGPEPVGFGDFMANGSMWNPNPSYADAAQGWYTGANPDGTNNGWDTGWMTEAYKQYGEMQDRASKQEDPTKFYDWFDRKDATGIAMWNDVDKGVHVGDVYNDGKKVANVYDDFGREGGNLMMAEFALDAETKEQIYNDPDRDRWLDDEIKGIVEENTTARQAARGSMKFEAAQEERQAKLESGSGDDLLVGGGALAGAGMGAAAGIPLGPIGVGVGAGVGFLAGGVSAWLNKDQLTEQTSRAMEITSIANRKYGGAVEFTTGLKEFSGVGLRLINPVSNIVQGSYDRMGEGEGGDNREEFYAVDANGERKPGMWWRTADVAGTLADSALQFTNPVGIALYMTGTGGHVAGQVGTMAQTGAGWNDRTAQFDDYEGAGEWSAAVGAVGIDVVQFGMAGALAKAGVAARSAVALPATRAAGEAGVSRIGRLMPWRKTQEGTSSSTVSGMKFTIDDATGAAISARPTLTLLAPSEVMRWVPATWRARNRAALSSGVAGPDDYYRAALELAGGNRFSYAIINGWAEGSEEAVQAVLEPTSFSADIDPGQVVESYFYGMASGAGMSLGRVTRPPSTNDVQKYRAQALYQMRNQTGQLSAEEWEGIWKGMSKADRERAALPSAEEQEQIANVIRANQEAMQYGQVNSPIGVAGMRDLQSSAYARDLASVNPNAENTLVLAGMTGDHVMGPNGEVDSDLFQANMGSTSAWQAVDNIVNLHTGLQVQAADMQRRLEEHTEALAAATAANDTEATARIQQALDEVNAEITQAGGVEQVAEVIRSWLQNLYEDYRSATDTAAAEAAIDAINSLLASAYNGRLRDENGALFAPELQEFARRSVEMRMARHPFIDSGSFVLLMPQVSKALSAANAHGQIAVHQSVLKAFAGDHDGDTLVGQTFTTVPQGTLDQLRAGAQYLQRDMTKVVVGKDTDGNDITEDREQVTVVVDAPDNEKLSLQMLTADFASDPISPGYAAAENAVATLVSELHARYTGKLDEAQLKKALKDFREDVQRGNPDARLNLATKLFNINTAEMLQLGRENNFPELTWLMQRISLEWHRHQTASAANSEDLEFKPADARKDLPAPKAYLRSISMQEMANDAQTLAALTRGANPTRDTQKVHYSVFRAAIDIPVEGTVLPELAEQFIALYAAMGSNISQSEMDRVKGRNSAQKRVAFWLEQMAEQAKDALGVDASQALVLLASMQVRDMRVLGDNQYEFVDGDISLAQLLLKRSVEIERRTHRATLENDDDLKRKLNRLDGLTRRDQNAERSVTPQLALAEVLGHVQFFDLLGDSSKYLGPQRTINQIVASLANLSGEARSQALWKMKRKAPYVMHTETGNPPYSLDALTSGNISAYRVVVDAIQAITQTVPRDRKNLDKTKQDEFTQGITNLQSMIESYRKAHSDSLGDKSPAVVLEAMLKNNPQLAGTIAALIPDAAKLGVFRLVDGKVYSAPWVMDMLTQDPEKAAVTYFVYSKLSEWKQLGYDLERPREKDPETGELKPHEHPRSYSKIRSRMLQVFYRLAQDPSGIELDRLLIAMKNAPNLPALMESINSESAWIGDSTPLLAMYDDVAMFETDPSEVWQANLPGTLQRDAIKSFAERTMILSTTMAKQVAQLESERVLIDNLEAYDQRQVDRAGAAKLHARLELAIKNRVMFPDHIGPASRDRFTTKIQGELIRMHDKGKPDPAIAPIGDYLVTADEYGVKQAVMQEVDALTAYDPEDILTNPTKLADGPVRVGLADGSVVTVDLTTTRGAIAALKDPLTSAFAKRVLFATARDINTVDTLQHYQDTRSENLSLVAMLNEQDFHDLFSPVGERMTVAQAHKYISMLESGIRKDALGKSDEELEAAYFPLQKIINEFLVAYSHRPGAPAGNKQAERDDLYVDIAMALQAVAALDRQDAPGEHTLLESALDMVKATLKERFIRDSSGLNQILGREAAKAATDVMIVDALQRSYTKRVETLKAQQADPSLTQAERDIIKAEVKVLSDRIQDRVRDLEMMREDDTVTSVINMFTLTGNPQVDIDRMSAIRRFLGTANRIGRFHGNYLLIDKFNALLAYDPANALNDTELSPDEWKELASYAATVYLAEMSGRSGSSVTLTPVVLGPEGENMRRYFDASWSYLLDGFRDEKILEKAKFLAKQANWQPTVGPDTVVGILTGGLFNEKKLGGHTEMIVSQSLKAQQVMASASVGLAIPVGGELPKEMAAYAGAGRALFKRPEPDMLTATTFTVDTGLETVDWTPEQYLKLNHHFASKIVLRGTDPGGGPITVDLMPEVGRAYLAEDSVLKSGYQFLTVQRINDAISKHLNSTTFAGPIELDIEYFDVDTKPYTREWANNIYFEGVDRNGEHTLSPGLVAGQFFGTGAISKQAQQNPLDMATKKGQAYKAVMASAMSHAVAMEQFGSVAEVLQAKTMWMLDKEYDYGKLLPGDNTSIYKLMKQRHVVVGLNDKGEKEVWWAEKAIAWENTKGALPLTNVKLVALTDSQAQSLLGEPGTKGLRGVVMPSTTNLADMDTFPEITTERLTTLGLTRLGEESTLRETPFAAHTPLGRIQWSGDRADSNVSRYQERIRVLKHQQLEVNLSRTTTAKTGPAAFDINRINEANVRVLKKLLGTEGLASLFTRLKIPFLEARDMAELDLTNTLTNTLEKLTAVRPSSVIWLHNQGMSPIPAEGVLSEIVTRDAFGNLPTPAHRPTFEDIVVIDLDLFEKAAGGNMVEAYKEARDVVRAYTQMGVTIVLAHGSGGGTLRRDLAEHLREGSEGYAPMAESRHFFEPISPTTYANKTRRGLESTLIKVNQFKGDSVILTANSDHFGEALSENTTYWDLRDGQPVWEAAAMTLLPTEVGDMYGMPVAGTGMLDQQTEVATRTLELLDTALGRKHIRTLTGGDPKGVPIYRLNENGVEEPGIRSLDEAMDRLQSLLQAGKHPISVGEELMVGDLVPLIGADGTIMLLRVGFKIPDYGTLKNQVDTAVGQKKPVKGEHPAKWATSTNELQAAWTVRPPSVIQEVNPDPHAGTSVLVKYNLSRYGKSVTEGDGWKTIRSPMPNDFAGPAEPLAANGIRVNSYSGRKAPESKQALLGQARDFGWLFAITGIDFRQDMVEYFLGKRQRTESEEAQDWASVSMFLNKIAEMDHSMEPSEIADLLDTGSLLAVQADVLTAMAVDVFGPGYQIPGVATPFQRNTDPVDRLGQVLIASLMAPGIRLEDVIGTSGLFGLERLDGGAQVTVMPEVFTDALNSFDFPELRNMLFDRANANLPVRADGTRPYVFTPDWQFHIEITNPLTGETDLKPSTLQVSLEYPADENPVNYVQSAVRSTRQDESQHVGFVNFQTIRGRLATEKAPVNVAQMFSDQGQKQFEDDGGFWQMMRAVPALQQDTSYKPWRKKTPLQRLFLERGHNKVKHYLMPIDMDGWTADEKAAYERPLAKAMATMNLSGKYRTDMDYLVRMMFGMPASGPDQDNGIGKVSPAIAAQAAEMIAANVANHLIPTHGGVVPLPDKNFMALLFQENIGKAKPWAPKASPNRKSKLASSWPEWVAATFGQVRESSELFDSTFRVDLDGFMHTYQGATEDMADMPISLDELVDLKLVDGETNEFITSLDPGEQALLLDPIILETMNVTLDVLAGHAPTVDKAYATDTSASELAKRIEKHAQWHATKKMPKQQKVSTRAYIEDGAWYIQSKRDTHAFFHGLVNLSVGMRLLNPALWTSAVLEVAVRNSLEGAVNILQGKTKATAGIAEAVGWEPAVSREELKQFDKLYHTMGSDNRFLAVVYDQLAYQNLVEAGRGPVGRGLERFARFSALATSDPRFGLVAKGVAKRYVEGAWEALQVGGNAITVQQFITEMNRNPLWLQEQFPAGRGSPHTIGLNRVAQSRSMKQTVPGKLVMGGIDAMTQHPNWGVNFAGTMLKIPFLFTRFNMNMIGTVAGLGGYDQMLAMAFDQRESPMLGRIKSLLKGEPYNPDLHDRIDMSDVIESVDLVRPFLKTAVTHTGLMAAAMAAGGLGLSGEDEESKRRRRMAEYLGTPYYYDPRAYQNDFRTSDALYLDWLWDPVEMMFRAAPTVDGEGSVSAAVPHWIIRQFLSPVVGIEKFMETGDIRQIKWGFADAMSVLPNSVTRLWNEASLTGDLLAEAAANETKLGTPENNANANQYLLTLVGVYEKALLENSFVNAIRNGSDKYDRDPWTLPQIINGEIQRDLMQNPEPTKGLTTFVDPETGELMQGYTQRGDMSARLHQFAENNATAAMILSLTTGQWSGDSTYLRKNMLVNTQEVELNPANRANAELLILSAMQGSGGFENLTIEEIERGLKADVQAKGGWWDQAEITAQARKIYAEEAGKREGAMSLLDKAGREILTQEGAGAIFRSLATGAVELGDPALRGIYIPTTMREEIEAQWARELVAEGIEMGLDEYTAKSRAKRLWYGNTYDDPNATGLRALLWSDQIPKDGKIVYNQLNTTFTLGPDGRPWATPFQRQNLFQALGVPWPSQALITEEGGLGVDSRGNVVDNVVGINTGLHALERVEESWKVEQKEDKFESELLKPFQSTNQYEDKKGGWNYSGWKDFGGGGGGGGGGAYFTKMYSLPGNIAPYGNAIPMVNTSNPIIRRTQVRRERVWSERGRLMQWQ